MIGLAATVAIACVLVGALAGDSAGGVAVDAQAGRVVWWAKMETGNLSEWSKNGTEGGPVDSGRCVRPRNGVSQRVAHSGRFSMAMTIDTSDGSAGCRQARYEESKTGEIYYYGAWLYLPTFTRAETFWNIFQFKSKEDGADESEPFWVLDLMPRSRRVLALRLRWKGLVDGPFSGDDRDRQTWTARRPINVPIRRWFHVEVYLQPSDGGQYDGRIAVWQDGVKLWDFDDVKTRFDDGDTRWSVNNYSDRLVPRRATLYVDDATVATCRVGPWPGRRPRCAQQ